MPPAGATVIVRYWMIMQFAYWEYPIYLSGLAHRFLTFGQTINAPGTNLQLRPSLDSSLEPVRWQNKVCQILF